MSSSSYPAPTPKPLIGSGKTEKKSRIDPWWGLVAVVVALILILNFSSPDPYNRILVFLQEGIWVTVKITLISFLLVMVLGLFVGLARLSKNTIVRGIATVYVEVIRGIPMMVQIIFWYFASPAIVQQIGTSLNNPALANFRPDGTTKAIFGLTFGYAAYMSEVYRAGIQSISRGQMEAARSLGMTYFQAMRYVILPQAVRVILPPVGNEFITLLKDTALVSAVAVPDMTRRGREFQASTFIIIETCVMVALVYLVMTLLATRLVSWVAKRSKFERYLMEPIIHVKNVHKWCGTVHAFQGVNLDILKGQVVVVIGPSGSGKSTLLRCINRLEEFDEGKIIVDGIPLDSAKNINAVRTEVGMVFQSFNLFPPLRVMVIILLAH